MPAFQITNPHKAATSAMAPMNSQIAASGDIPRLDTRECHVSSCNMVLGNLKPRTTVDPRGIAIAHRLRDLRERMGLRQDQFCFFFDISRLTYWRWERYGPPRAAHVRRYCEMVIRQLRERLQDKQRWQRDLNNKRKAHAQAQARYRRRKELERAAAAD
jgi:transcriptional regulator with XRE-family HTH domain